MSHLLIDQGNTRLKAAWRDGDGIGEVYVGTDTETLLRGLDRTPTQVWISSVADKRRRELLLDQIGRRWQCPTRWITVAAYAQHLPTRYRKDQLGVDRWLALLACRQRYGTPLVVVDSGTATTIDLVDVSGEHLGGVILPGFDLMQQALMDATAIKVSGTTDRQQWPPRDTVSAIALGGPMAVAALIERQRERLGPETRLVIGGGAAPCLQDLLGGSLQVLGQLVLHGLSVLSRLEEE